ncbi:hypothetical protein BJ165DRAFT_1057077 [Panaeolus papilionaceus]|nr:hypothetical protein BJ165DRAFT_1057077 [Panaeolus papilionaceus]
MTDLLANFPYELVLEVSSYLRYRDIQSFRLSNRRISKIVEHLALAKLKLDLDKINQEGCLNVPLDKYRAYAEPYATRATEHVRHLTISGLCINFSAPKCSYEHETGCDDLLLCLPHPHEHREVIYRRIKLFFEVIDRFFVSPAFGKLQTIRWEIPPCKMHDGDDAEWDGECSNMFDQLMPLVLRNRETPLHRFEIIALEQGILPKFPALPLCKELDVTGMPEYRTSHNGQCKTMAIFVEETILSNPHLEVLDWDLVLNKKVVDHLLSGENGALVQKVQHISLTLAHWGGRLQESMLGAFRNIRCLSLYCDEPRNGHNSSLLCESDMAPLWLQLVEEQIFVEELRFPLNQVGDSCIEYLLSYPTPSLKLLRLQYLRNDAEADYASSEVAPERFYKKVMPVIAPGLVDLGMKTNEVNNWCFGVLPDSLTAFRKCTSLAKLTIPMKGSGDLEDIVRQAFSGLPRLRKVDVHIPLERGPNDRSPRRQRLNRSNCQRMAPYPHHHEQPRCSPMHLIPLFRICMNIRVIGKYLLFYVSVWTCFDRHDSIQ